MELFDKKFVYFMWDDELRGKECFYDDDIAELRKSVDENEAGFKGCLEPSTNTSYPFRPLHAAPYGGWRFAYYDPNYAYKVAYNEGKKIQHRRKGEKDWSEGTPAWDSRYEYRIKPVTYYVGIGISKTLTCHSTPTPYKHVYASFDNPQDADKWIEARKKFVPVMRAFEKDIPIEYQYKGGDWAEASTPSWDLRLRYRVKPTHTKFIHTQTKFIQQCQHCSGCAHVTKSFTSEPCSKCFDASRWEPMKRRMTNRELAQWLAEGKGQKASINGNALTYHTYEVNDDDKPAHVCMIREWNETKWHEPDVAKEEVE